MVLEKVRRTYTGSSRESRAVWLPERSPVALPLRPLPLASPLSHLLLLVPVRVAMTDLVSHGHRAKLARFGAVRKFHRSSYAFW